MPTARPRFAGRSPGLTSSQAPLHVPGRTSGRTLGRALGRALDWLGLATRMGLLAALLGLGPAGLAASATGPGAELPFPVRFNGLHGGKANLLIDRRRVVLGAGETSDEGLRVEAVSAAQVVFRIDGRGYRLERGAAQSTALREEVVIERQRGMFFTPGEVNGQRVEFIVDTGASHVVLSQVDARRLRLRYSTHEPVRVQTASGAELAYPLTLESVAVGDIVQAEVSALIVRGKAPSRPLLGMTFLRELRFTQTGDSLIIKR